MSNAQVGTVYQQIIADVVESSRVDFEEGGVDDATLEELKTVWQQKLSQLNVATFPWDPKPEPPSIAQPPTVPSNANAGPQSAEPYQHPSHSQSQQQPPPGLGQNGNGPRIKSEPGLESGYPIAGTTAQQRAAQHLQQNYGQRAAASINAIQQGLPQQNGGAQGQVPQPINMQQQLNMQQVQYQQQRMQAAQQGNNGTPQQRLTPEQFAYRQQMMQQAQARMQAQQQQGGIGGAQTDGVSDESEVVGAAFDAEGRVTSMGRIEIDGLIRERILSMGTSMEGGGLMLPLAQASTASNRRIKSRRGPSHPDSKGKELVRSQMDGQDDDDVKPDIDEDEDAINSDLDDPDDGLGEEDDDEDGELGQIMLCMYDKVQRVKNKW